MKKYTHLKITLFLIFLVLISCQDNKKTTLVKAEDPYLKELTEKQIGKSNFYISIPKKYFIKEKEGPDFSVYYFFPTDTTVQAHFSGGLYFGNHPSQFQADADSCKTKIVKSKILNVNKDWTIYNCKGHYSLQTIVDSGSSEGWNAYIHAFGGADSEKEMKKMLTIFRTLKMKKAH